MQLRFVSECTLVVDEVVKVICLCQVIIALHSQAAHTRDACFSSESCGTGVAVAAAAATPASQRHLTPRSILRLPKLSLRKTALGCVTLRCGSLSIH